MKNITKVLIANRGEIATRIARAAAACDIESLAVYAREDALSLHTRQADQRVQLAEAADPGTAQGMREQVVVVSGQGTRVVIDCGHFTTVSAAPRYRRAADLRRSSVMP